MCKSYADPFGLSDACRSREPESGFPISKNNIILMTMSTEANMNDASPSASQEGGSSAPSGFILKLYQMVNGAPDEVISVSRMRNSSSSNSLASVEGLVLQKLKSSLVCLEFTCRGDSWTYDGCQWCHFGTWTATASPSGSITGICSSPLNPLQPQATLSLKWRGLHQLSPLLSAVIPRGTFYALRARSGRSLDYGGVLPK